MHSKFYQNTFNIVIVDSLVNNKLGRIQSFSKFYWLKNNLKIVFKILFFIFNGVYI